ncbi:MAG: hypothetical protein EA352_03570 [Gemmatimonadales bacterium]|nr:MAG: hypothetical protein EA352_03570 [Gemmatimonadales bacterium]
MQNIGALMGRLTITAMAALLVAAPLNAQEPPPVTPPPQQQMQQPQLPDSVQDMMDEYQELNEEVGMLQEQAIAGSEELQERRDALDELIMGKITGIEPEFEALIERLNELEQEAQAAQQQQDMETLQALMNEGQAIQERLQGAQNEALESEEVEEHMNEFQDHLIAEMTEYDEDVPEKIERLEDLAERLNAALEEIGFA